MSTSSTNSSHFVADRLHSSIAWSRSRIRSSSVVFKYGFPFIFAKLVLLELREFTEIFRNMFDIFLCLGLFNPIDAVETGLSLEWFSETRLSTLLFNDDRCFKPLELLLSGSFRFLSLLNSLDSNDPRLSNSAIALSLSLLLRDKNVWVLPRFGESLSFNCSFLRHNLRSFEFLLLPFAGAGRWRWFGLWSAITGEVVADSVSSWRKAVDELSPVGNIVELFVDSIFTAGTDTETKLKECKINLI